MFAPQKNLKLPFDKILFNLTRLDIVGNLNEEPPIPFTELRDVLEITDGNLANHLKALEKHDIVIIHKSFVGKKPHTRIELTAKGKEDFEKLKDWFYQSFLEC